MKKIALVSTLAMALAPAFANAGGELGQVVTPPPEPVAVAPVVPGGVGVDAPAVAAAGAIPWGALAAAGAGGLLIACAIACFDDDDDDTPATTTTTD